MNEDFKIYWFRRILEHIAYLAEWAEGPSPGQTWRWEPPSFENLLFDLRFIANACRETLEMKEEDWKKLEEKSPPSTP
jgi:hypothetical protein